MNFAMKKPISLLLTLFMIFSGITVVQAKEPDSKYVMVDIGQASNAEMYLNTSQFWDGVEANRPNWYWATYSENMTDFLTWGSSYHIRFALEREALEQQLDNGILYDKSDIPYSMPLHKAINVQGEVSPSTVVDITDGVYTKVHFLAMLYQHNGYSHFRDLSVILNYADGSTETINKTAEILDDSASQDVSNFVIAAKAGESNQSTKTEGQTFVIRKSENLGTDAEKELNIYTYAVEANPTKNLDSITFVSNAKQTNIKVLAVTAEKLDVQSFIADMNKAIEDGDYQKAQSLLTQIESFTDETALNYLTSEEYTAAKNIIEANITYFKTVDIADFSNAEVYKDGVDMSYNVASSSPDYFPWGTTFYYRFGLQKDSVASYLVDGIAYDQSKVPYSMPLEKAINVQGTTSPSTTVDLDDGIYSELHFLSAAVDIAPGITTFRATLNYTDGSTSYVDYDENNYYGRSSSLGTENSRVMTVQAYRGVWTNISTGTNTMSTATEDFTIHTYAVPVAEGKVLDSVTFSSSNLNTTAKVLAITLETAPLADMKSYIESKLSDVDALKDDIKTIETVSGMLELLEDNGADVTQFENYSDFIFMKDRMISVSDYTVMTETDMVDVTVEFTVEPESLSKDLVKLYKRDAAVATTDYFITMTDAKTVKLSFRHALDFASQYKVVLSSNISSAVDSEYTLGADVEIIFIPEPQTKIAAFEIFDNDGTYTSLAEAAGKTVTLKAVFEGDLAAEFFIVFYDENNEMKILLSGTIVPVSGEYIATTEITLPENVKACALESYIFNDNTELKLLCPRATIK